MANLPNKSFVFNYNARNYNPSTYTIPMEEGASMQKDMVWSATTNTVRSQITFNDDHINVPLSAFSHFEFSTSGANPVNNTANAPAMTVVAKFKLTNGGPNFLCNRDGSIYNFMARVGSSTSGTLSLHTSSSNASSGQYATYTPGTVVTALWRVNTSRQVEIKNLTENTSNTPFTPSWFNGSKWFDFFIWMNGSAVTEPMAGEFYWCYLSKEYLTDEEVQAVVDYNDITTVFKLDSTGTTIQQNGGTATVGIESELAFTATTTYSWISISPTTGDSSTTQITMSCIANVGSNDRVGTVVFENAEGSQITYTITQEGIGVKVPNKMIYRNGNRIN